MVVLYCLNWPSIVRLLCVVACCPCRRRKLSPWSGKNSTRSRWPLVMVQMTFQWSRQLTLVSVCSANKVWVLFNQVIMHFRSSECYGDYCWSMVGGIISESARWFCTFSTRIWSSPYLSTCLHSFAGIPVKLCTTTFTSLCITYCLHRCHWWSGPFSNRT